MSPDVLLPYLVGPYGGLIIALLAIYGLWRELQDAKRRNDRLDAVTEGALSTAEGISQRTEGIVNSQQQILAAVAEIRAEQGHAKDREDWRRP